MSKLIWKRSALRALTQDGRSDVAEQFTATEAGRGAAYVLLRFYDAETAHYMNCAYGTEPQPGFATVQFHSRPETGFTAFTLDRDGDISKRLGFSPSLRDAKRLCGDHSAAAAAERKRKSVLRRLRGLAWSAYRYGSGRRSVTLA